MAMYNRYRGNSGRPEKVAEPKEQNRRPPPPQPRPPQPRPPQKKPQSQMPLLGGSLSRLIPEKLGELETEDLLLILILYLMYRESGDKDLLIIMGAMYLL